MDFFVGGSPSFEMMQRARLFSRGKSEASQIESGVESVRGRDSKKMTKGDMWNTAFMTRELTMTEERVRNLNSSSL